MKRLSFVMHCMSFKLFAHLSLPNKLMVPLSMGGFLTLISLIIWELSHTELSSWGVMHISLMLLCFLVLLVFTQVWNMVSFQSHKIKGKAIQVVKKRTDGTWVGMSSIFSWECQKFHGWSEPLLRHVKILIVHETTWKANGSMP